jgi:phospholipid transport system substrate-binding protein
MRIYCLLVLAAALFFGSVAQAESDTAQSFLKTRQGAVTRILEKTPKDQQGDELSKAIGDLLDYDELSKRALSDHWSTRSEAERQEFVSLLKQLVERNYRKNLRSTRGYEVRQVGSEKTPEGTVIKTSAKSKTKKRQPPIEIAYTLWQPSGSWRVVDITTDGVSMVRNYRSQFNRIIRKDGWDALIKRMKDRLANAGDF